MNEVQYRIKIPEGSSGLVDLRPDKVLKAEIIKDNKAVKKITPEGLAGKFELSVGEYLIYATI